MRLYYLLWVDCIVKMKANPVNAGSWKLKAFLLFTFAQAMNLFLVTTILQHWDIARFYDIDLDPAPVKFFVLFMLPWVPINYFLIFYNERYLVLIKKYPYKNGNFIITYFALSLLTPVFLLWGGIILSRLI